jgi:PPOX class probable F420-dependent enzyme
MDKIPQSHEDLLRDEKKAFVVLSTLMSDSAPQATPVWFNIEDGFILINSAKGRIKDQNMRRCPQVALVILDPQNPYRYIQVCGRVIEIITQGAEAHIHQLSHKYTGHDYPLNPEEIRVKYKILPENVTVGG